MLNDFLTLQVSLEEKKAVILYDTRTTNPAQLQEHIDDMGFEATLLDELRRDCSMSDKCVISIKGMTCNSCVRNIEGTIGEKMGIKNIKVRF